MVTASVRVQDDDEFFCTFVYARNLVEEKKELWEDICHHKNSPLFQKKSWLLMEDFNEILDVEESPGSSVMGTLPPGMRDFQRMVFHCNLSDMGYQGPRFTWCNKREEGVICKKLDKVLMNDVALQRSPPKIKRPFKFVNVIGRLPAFLPMII